MGDDRLFRVIVLGGLSLVGSSACGRAVTNGSVAEGDSAPAADGGMSAELGDARDGAVSEPVSRGDGGPSDLVRVPFDASDDASRQDDADLAGDSTSDAQECGVESFPTETAIATCAVRCVPSGCPCVVPSGCSCLNCTNTVAPDSGGP